MSDKSIKTKKMLAKNADKITIAVLALILLGLGYAYWQEQSNTLGSDVPTGKPVVLNDNLADDPAFKMLQNMSGQTTMNPEVKRVAELSMFDFSTLQQESALETQAQQQLKQAQELITQGQTEQARPLLENAAKVVSYNPEALKLLDSITTKSTDAGMSAAPGAEQMPPM